MNKKTSYDEISRLSRADIIKTGLEQIKNNLGFDQVGELIFDKISVFTNHEIFRIHFSNPIKYIPFNAEFFYDVTVYIPDGAMSYEIHANPVDYKGTLDTPFFKSNVESEKIIQFVIDAINKDAGIEPGETKENFLKDFEGNLIIRDGETHYEISRTSDYQESWYSIHKQSGEISDGGHAHLVPPPEVEDGSKKFIEITS